MRLDDVDDDRGHWVACRRSDEVVIAAATSLEARHRALEDSMHPQVLIHRVPAINDPIYFSLADWNS